MHERLDAFQPQRIAVAALASLEPFDRAGGIQAPGLLAQLLTVSGLHCEIAFPRG